MIRLLRFAFAALLVACAFAAQAQNPQFQVGDRVAMPSGDGVRYLDAVIIRIAPDSSSPYRVHPLGYLDTMDYWSNGKLLRPYGSVPTEPPGKIADDPYLLALQGKQAFKPVRLYTGAYECWGWGEKSRVPIYTRNFTILDDRRYRDADNQTNGYRFDAGTRRVTFMGGVLNGVSGGYYQASDPPTKAQPPAVELPDVRCVRSM